jgi:histidinol phosphatase-like PHP family hydrolase
MNLQSFIFDIHCHTELAYCGQDVSAEEVLACARQAGIAGVCLTEHAPQLYCTAEEFWDARHLEPAVWTSPENARMDDFRRLVQPLRNGTVLVGLEVELDHAGQLTLHPTDRDFADLVVGAMHFRPSGLDEGTPGQRGEWFLQTARKMLDHDIDVLAHPFRIFARFDEPLDHLYAPLAEMLAETDTAAEINFHHTSRPAVAFFAECIARGVKIAIGSDAHNLEEVGDYARHLDVLREAAGRSDVRDLIYNPLARA